MSDGPSLETYGDHANSSTAAPENQLDAVHAIDEKQASVPALRVAILVGISVVSATLAYAIVRKTLRRAPSDPTTERIQQLIDEANRLLKQRDEKKLS